jgi:exopolysaccharide biosynthesis polyprenyl glycosylphosphotransferase
MLLGRDALNQEGIARIKSRTIGQAVLIERGQLSLSPSIDSSRNSHERSIPKPATQGRHTLFIAAVVLLDLTVIGIGFVVPALTRFTAGTLAGAASNLTGIFVLVSSGLLWVVMLSARDAYSPAVMVSMWGQALRITSVVLPAWVLTHLLAFLAKFTIPFESRLVVGLSLPATLLALWSARLGLVRPLAYLVYPRLARGIILLLGDTEHADRLADETHDRDPRGREVVSLPFAGIDACELGRLVEVNGVGEVVIDPAGRSLEEVLDLAFASLNARAEVRVISNRFHVISGRSSIDDYDGIPVLKFHRTDLAGPETILRRGIDLVGASVGILLLSPVLAGIALAVKLSSPGPVLFRQERIGRRGHRFTMLKFRTMVDGNDSAIHREYLRDYIREGAPASIGKDGARIYKLTCDPRVTRIGAWLRTFSLDELPQLWNVLRGEMGLVGPRPCLSYEWEVYRPWQRRRLDVKPGCTGLWQVTARSRVNFEDMVILDLHYAHHRSVASDLLLIAQTVPAMLRGRGGY